MAIVESIASTAPVELPQSYVLIVDDEPAVRQSLARGLMESGYPCVTAKDGTEALARLRLGRFAVMLTDISMPGMSGLDLLAEAVQIDPDMPVIMVTALAGLQTALGAIRAGAYDYLTKPFAFAEVEMLLARALEYRRLRVENRRYVEQLEEMVEQKARQLRQIAVGVITSLGLALEAKDEWTHDHSRRVADVSAQLALQLGLNEHEMADLRLAGMLHDIGKIGVRESVLHKGGSLTVEEFAHIKQHPTLGARILSPLHELDRVIPYIRHHHERWDGAGYPDRLRAEDIPHGARIIGVADAYVAMRERRPYRDAMSLSAALTEVREGRGKQFDRDIAGALLTLHDTGVLLSLDQRFPQNVPEMYIP